MKSRSQDILYLVTFVIYTVFNSISLTSRCMYWYIRINLRMQQGLGIMLAVLAGTMAALASVCAKLAMTEEAVKRICKETIYSVNVPVSVAENLCDSVSIGLRVLCFVMIFMFNALMWTFYTKSLQYTSSTVEATITNTGANFFVTAMFGFIVFQENLSVMWWAGSCLILGGLLLIHSGNKDADQKEKVT